MFQLGCGFLTREIAEELGIGYRALRNIMITCGISVRALYSNISSEELESLVFQIHQENSSLGVKMIVSRLFAMGYRVQRQRVRDAMQKLFGSRQVNRRLKRRTYCVRAPLSVVHIDGNHKLIR